MLAVMNRRMLIGLALGGLAPALALAVGPARASPDKDAGGAGGYLPLPTATATVLRRDGRRGVMSVEVGLDVADAALLERARLSQPRLSAAYNEVVRLAGLRLLPDAPPDVEWLAFALQHVTDRILGQPGAKMLLGTVMAA
jgi:hypothetical protein